MAHLVTGYAGYAHISSADDGAFNASFFGDGQNVMESGNCFAGSIIDNNTVRILDGDGLMYGRHFRIEPNSYEDMVITTGTAGTNRIDLICMTYEKNAEDETERCYLQVIKGAETDGTAVVPEYTDGNILEGATFNQMPLYRVVIEGVVLKEIEAVFETIPTYKALAEYYADVFQKRCDDLVENLPIDALKPEDVVDNLLSESTDLPLSANQGRLLGEKIEEVNANLISENNQPFKFGYKESQYGYWIKEADTDVFIPFNKAKVVFGTFVFSSSQQTIECGFKPDFVALNNGSNKLVSIYDCNVSENNAYSATGTSGVGVWDIPNEGNWVLNEITDNGFKVGKGTQTYTCYWVAIKYND